MFDEFLWEYTCKTRYPPKNIQKKHNPKDYICRCGYAFKFNKQLYMKMIKNDGINLTCPKCQRTHRFKLIYHTICENTQTKKQNTNIWRNG